MIKYIRNLFYIEDNFALSNLIIAIGLFSLSEFVHSNVNSTIGFMFVLLAWCFIFRACKTVDFRRANELGCIKTLIILLLMWNVFMIVYGLFSYPPQEESLYYIVRRLLSDTYLFLPMLIPLFVFFENSNLSLRFLFYWIAVFTVIYLFLSPWAIWSMTHWNFDYSLGYYGDENGEYGYGDFISNSTHHIAAFAPIAFTFFSKRYLSDKWWRYFVLAAIIGLFIGLFMARRGRVVIYLGTYLAAYWVYFRRSNNKLIKVLILLVFVVLNYTLFMNLSDSVFSLLMERGVEDTREGVEQSMMADFDETPLDWWIGRGLWGTYYDPNFFSLIIGDRTNRNLIETGYLNMIIHGGYVYLALYLFILVYSGIKGVFCSRNILVNSLGCLILISVLELYPWGLQRFEFKYLLIWLGVYICSQSHYREMNDDDIYNDLFKSDTFSNYDFLLNKVFK